MSGSQRGPRRGPGFTFAEIVVAAAIGVVVTGAALLVLQLGSSSRGATGAIEALAAAMLVEERIESDLRRLVALGPCPVRFWPDDPSRLSFWAVDPSIPPGKKLSIRAVAYARDRASRFLVREWGEGKEHVGTSSLASIAFFPFLGPTGPAVRVSMAVDRPPGDPPGPPIAHSFLVRLPAPRHEPGVGFDLVSGFIDPADAPGDQDLPMP